MRGRGSTSAGADPMAPKGAGGCYGSAGARYPLARPLPFTTSTSIVKVSLRPSWWQRHYCSERNDARFIRTVLRFDTGLSSAQLAKRVNKGNGVFAKADRIGSHFQDPRFDIPLRTETIAPLTAIDTVSIGHTNSDDVVGREVAEGHGVSSQTMTWPSSGGRR
jgi:hypothetical protein